MKKPKNKPTVRLIGEEGNAFSILGRVAVALKRAGADEEYIQKFNDEATSGDYNNLLQVATRYVDAE